MTKEQLNKYIKISESEIAKYKNLQDTNTSQNNSQFNSFQYNIKNNNLKDILGKNNGDLEKTVNELLKQKFQELGLKYPDLTNDPRYKEVFGDLEKNPYYKDTLTNIVNQPTNNITQPNQPTNNITQPNQPTNNITQPTNEAKVLENNLPKNTTGQTNIVTQPNNVNTQTNSNDIAKFYDNEMQYNKEMKELKDKKNAEYNPYYLNNTEKQNETTHDKIISFIANNPVTKLFQGVGSVTGLPLIKGAVDLLTLIGLNKKYSKTIDNVLEANNKDMSAYNDNKPPSIFSATNIGKVLPFILFPSSVSSGVLKYYGASIASGAAFGALASIGENADYHQAADDAVFGAAGGLLGGLIGKIGSYGIKRLSRVSLVENYLGVSYPAKVIKNLYSDYAKMSKAEFKAYLSDVPVKDQALYLLNKIGKKAERHFAKSFADDKQIAMLEQYIAKRTNIFNGYYNETNIASRMDTAKKVFDEMQTYFANKYPNPININPLIAKLKPLERNSNFANLPDDVSLLVKNLSNTKTTTNLSDLMQLRKDIGQIMKDTKDINNLKSLYNAKNELDDFIGFHLTKNTKQINNLSQMSKDTDITNDAILYNSIVQEYKNAASDERFFAAFKNHTSDTGTVDWVGLKNNLQTQKLFSPNAQKAFEIVKEFSEKFKTDKYLSSAIKSKNVAQGNNSFLYFNGAIISYLRDAFTFYGNRYDSLKIQSALRNSIKNAASPKDLSKAVAGLKFNPEFKTKILDIFKFMENNPHQMELVEPLQLPKAPPNINF